MKYCPIRFTCAAAILSVSFLILACSSKNRDTTPRPDSGSGPLVVSAIVVAPRPMDNVVRSSGTVLASESVDLSAEAEGRIEEIFFKEGAHVREHDLLVKINDDDLQAQLRKVELQLALSVDQEKRQQQLYDKSFISKDQYDVSVNQVNQQKADRDNILAAVRKREIRAPFDGVVGLRYVSEGSYVSPTMRIASIQKVNPLKIDFAIPERYADDVSVGDPVELRNDEGTLHFTGRLYAIEPKIDVATRTLQLRALCENKAEKIVPGAYVQIELHFKRTAYALMVPTEAVVPVLKGQTLLLAKGGVVRSVPVTTGSRTPVSVQITSGINPGDTVITSGIMQLRAGMRVAVRLE